MLDFTTGGKGGNGYKSRYPALDAIQTHSEDEIVGHLDDKIRLQNLADLDVEMDQLREANAGIGKEIEALISYQFLVTQREPLNVSELQQITGQLYALANRQKKNRERIGDLDARSDNIRAQLQDENLRALQGHRAIHRAIHAIQTGAIQLTGENQ